MPDNAVISALTSLLPSLPASDKPFPPLLVSQCESLLALSRQRASNLKLEEEIARAHACAEITCTRLRAQLRLPAIKSGAGAPCQPRVYAKLIKFLEGAMGDAAGSLTPRGRKRDGDGMLKVTPASGTGRKSVGGTRQRAELDVEDTPSKKRTVDRLAGSGFVGTIKSAQKIGAPSSDDKAPDFVMPSIRKLCKVFATPSMVPHVYTGTCIVLERAGIWSQEKPTNDSLKHEVLALVTALYLMVLTRMQEGQMTTETYTEVSDKSFEVFELGSDGAEQIEGWIDRLTEEGWCEGEDWYESVPEDVLVFEPDAGEVRSGSVNGEEVSGVQNGVDRFKSKDLDEPEADGILLPGLGTMLHEGIDWMSEEKCLDYKEWQAGIMMRLSTPTKAGSRRGKAIAVS